MKLKITILLLVPLIVFAGCGVEPGQNEETEPLAVAVHENVMLDLWQDNLTAFGVYAPSESMPSAETGDRAPSYSVEGARKLSENPLYDFVFLNLEGRYDGDAVRAFSEGLRSPTAVSRKSLIVRIPSLEDSGEEVIRERIKEIIDAGADGVTIPHVRDLNEAQEIAGFFTELGADVWTPKNPNGEMIAMLMLEDPDAIAQVSEIAEVEGISILACGIGSLTGAVAQARVGTTERVRPSEEDRVVAEAMNLRVLEESKRVGVADMITANAENVERRVQEGFLALLMSGPDADSTIEIGRAAAGRP